MMLLQIGMPYHRRRSSMALRPISRIKHVIDNSATVAAAAILTVNLIKAVDSPSLGSTIEVETASKVNGIYLKVEVASNEAFDSGAIPNVYMALAKNPGANLTFPAPNAVGGDDNKRFVIHQEMIMINNTIGGNPRVLFNGVIAIPRGYRRNGPNDLLQLFVLSPAINIAVCIQCHYKEFR